MVVQLLLAGAITPVPVPIPCECGGATHLTFSNVGPIPAKAGVVGQLVPGGIECSSEPMPRNPPKDMIAYATWPLSFSIIRRLIDPMFGGSIHGFPSSYRQR